MAQSTPWPSTCATAAASLDRALTERGQTDRVVLATGTLQDAGALPDWGAMLSPGTTLALYMVMHRLPDLAANLLAAGQPRNLEVEIVAHASQSGETRLSTTLGDMARAANDAGTGNPAIVFLRHPSVPQHGVLPVRMTA